MGDQNAIMKRNKVMECKEEDKETIIKPKTKRSASSCNWEAYKHTISKEETNLDKKNNRNSTKEFLKKSPKTKKSNLVSQFEKGNTMNDNNENAYEENTKRITKLVAMDCEMVGIGDGSESMIARVSIVNKYGYCLYDKYVKPREKVKDYRTAVSGIYPHHLANGEEFLVVQKEVAEILRGKILIGHAIKNDLSVLFLSHPWRSLRDTSRYKPFKDITKSRTPSLKKLALEFLGIEIQSGEHDSIEDARVAMRLYMLYRCKWESEIYRRKIN